jgi:hypothetical protein
MEDEKPKTATRPIYLVYVSTLDKGGERIPLDCTALDGLPEHPHQLGEKYGVPVVELIARDQHGQLVARVTHRTRVPLAAAAAETKPTAPASGFDALAVMQAVNDRTDKLMALLIQSKDAASAQIVQTIGQMAGQRIVDSQDLFSTILKVKGGGAGGEQKGELAAYLKGFNNARAYIAAAQGGGDDEDEASLEDLMKVALQGWMRGKAETEGGAQQREQPRPRPRAVPDPEDP